MADSRGLGIMEVRDMDWESIYIQTITILILSTKTISLEPFMISRRHWKERILRLRLWPHRSK